MRISTTYIYYNLGWTHGHCTMVPRSVYNYGKQTVRTDIRYAARAQNGAKPQEGQALRDSPFGDTLADAPPPRMAFSIAFTTPFAQ